MRREVRGPGRREETIIRIYCMKNKSIFNKRKIGIKAFFNPFIYLEMGSNYVTLAGLELPEISLSLPPTC